MSMMSTLLTGTKALRGRASLYVVVRPFDDRESAKFWRIKDPQVAFRVHAVVGGTPGYRELLARSAPSEAAPHGAAKRRHRKGGVFGGRRRPQLRPRLTERRRRVQVDVGRHTVAAAIEAAPHGAAKVLTVAVKAYPECGRN